MYFRKWKWKSDPSPYLSFLFQTQMSLAYSKTKNSLPFQYFQREYRRWCTAVENRGSTSHSFLLFFTPFHYPSLSISIFFWFCPDCRPFHVLLLFKAMWKIHTHSPMWTVLNTLINRFSCCSLEHLKMILEGRWADVFVEGKKARVKPGIRGWEIREGTEKRENRQNPDRSG